MTTPALTPRMVVDMARQALLQSLEGAQHGDRVTAVDAYYEALSWLDDIADHQEDQ